VGVYEGRWLTILLIIDKTSAKHQSKLVTSFQLAESPNIGLLTLMHFAW